MNESAPESHPAPAAESRAALLAAARAVPDPELPVGAKQISVRTVPAAAWTTDWMSETGRRKLREYGIAPPGPAAHAGGPVKLAFSVRCPHCGSADTREVSHFGSTRCQALRTCRSCAEPFDSFRAL